MITTFSCKEDFLKLLEELKNKTGIPKSKIIQLAVREWAIKKLYSDN